MGLLKEVNCADCGQKTSLLTRLALRDKNYICAKCKKALPEYVLKFAKGTYDLEDYKEAKRWVAEAVENYRDVFHPTDSYGGIQIDNVNGLFTLSRYSKGKTPVLRFDDMLNFDFAFKPEKYKEGMIGAKVTGTTYFSINMKRPNFSYEMVLDTAAKAKAKKSFFGNKITYDHPKDMSSFEQKFIETFIMNLPEEFTGGDPLQEAMTIFMIDDIGAIDAKGLIETRNSLLKSFQDGRHERQVQKINEAYRILSEKIGG